MGGFVLVVGPSGAGKDTLLRLACAELAGEPRLVLARRVITRPESAAEAHDTLDEAGFLAAAANGAFCQHWQAHGLRYGIPARYAAATRAGAVVVANVSRGVVASARAALPGVTAVEITAPAEILAARLAQRARPEDGDLDARLARATAATAQVDLRILNDSTPEQAAAQLLAHLRARLAETEPTPRDRRQAVGRRTLHPPDRGGTRQHVGAYTVVDARTKVTETVMGECSCVANDSRIIHTEIGRFRSIAAMTRINPGNYTLDRVALSHFPYRISACGLCDDDTRLFDVRQTTRGRSTALAR